MTLERLDNLVKTGEVHEEAVDQGEFERLVSMAGRRLVDSQVSGLSEEGQFFGGIQFCPLIGDCSHALARISNYQALSCISMPRTHRRNG